MFVYSIKASTAKYFSVITLSVLILAAFIAFTPFRVVSRDSVQSSSDICTDALGKDINFDRIKTNDDRIKFISQFGYTVNPEPYEQADVTVPKDFDKVFVQYNELQRSQGLDLSKYRRRTLQRYTYEITNYPDYEGKVYIDLLVFRSKVVAGDVFSADASGFLHGFEKE